MRRITLFISIFAFALTVISCGQQRGGSATQSVVGEWFPLFNGKDLNDWTVKINGYEVGYNLANTFHVEDGILKVRYDAEVYERFNQRFGHLFFKNTFSHYILRVEYRFVGEQVPGAPGWAYRNSGVMIHGQTPESMELNQEFPTSIEVQLLGSSERLRQTTLNLCTPGTRVVMNGELSTRHCMNSTSEHFFYDEWVTVYIEVRGNEVIRHWQNNMYDTPVLEYFQPQLNENSPYFARVFELNGSDKMLHGGTISLQSEGHPIDFRRVEIKLLEP
jgi:hypothetical protein